MDLVAWIGGACAVVAGMLAPGAAVVRALGLGASRLERLVLALAIGRVLFAAATLLAVSMGVPSALYGATGLGVAAWFVARRRRPAAFALDLERGSSRAVAAAALVALAGGALLVHAFVARSGLPDADGALVFWGRDSAQDPIVYAAAALRLYGSGLPLDHPFAAGSAATAQYVPLAVLAGLHAIAHAPMLELTFRIVPALDVASVILAGVALTRALGGIPIAAGIAGLALALGGPASFLLGPLGRVLGAPVATVDTWAFFGPYLLAFNPIAPALHALFAACLLLARAPVPRAAAIAAGLLFASLLETKLFLYLPAMGALAGVAVLRPPSRLAPALRLAAVAAAVGSLPSLAEKSFAALAYRGVGDVGLRACVGCLPRYLIDASLGSHDLSFASFRTFRHATLLEPGVVVFTLFATVLTLGLALGARLVALPALATAWRSDRAGGGDAVLRIVGLASLFGVGLSLVAVVSPHYLNGAQFSWSATFGLWPVVAVRVGAWLEQGRFAGAALVALLALPATGDALARLGWHAPQSLRVTADERALSDALARVSRPGDVVMEPSMLADTDRPSPFPWLAGRSVHLSLLSTAQNLSEAERDARFERLLAVFAEGDRAAAERALRESGARFLVTLPGWPLRFDSDGLLEPVASGPAGTIYRVRAAPDG